MPPNPPKSPEMQLIINQLNLIAKTQAESIIPKIDATKASITDLDKTIALTTKDVESNAELAAEAKSIALNGFYDKSKNSNAMQFVTIGIALITLVIVLIKSIG